MKVTLLLVFIFVGLSFVYEDFNTPKFEEMKKEIQNVQSKLDFSPPKVNFNCPKIPPSNPEPNDATKLRPSDIKVIMALGDSVTAGFAMVSQFFSTF